MPLQNRRGNQNRNAGQRNMNSNKGQAGTGQRIRLRRNVNKQQLIQQNLSHMQQSAHKKKLAQELYYNNQGNRSPLVRTTNVNRKPPVHNRLGVGNTVTTIKQNTNRQFLTTKNQGGNRIKLRRQGLQPEQIIKNNIIRNKNERGKRLQNSAQNRILRIRQNNPNQHRQLNQNNAGQKVRLRRMRPVNYTVEVVNTSNKKHQHQQFKHSLNNALNMKLQQEIRDIQSKNINHDEIPSIPIYPLGTGFTGTTLNDRFSQL